MLFTALLDSFVMLLSNLFSRICEEIGSHVPGCFNDILSVCQLQRSPFAPLSLTFEGLKGGQGLQDHSLSR